MDEMPEVEDLDPQEWKLLFMVLAENRGQINFYQHLTPYGISLLDSIRRKLGIMVVGVDIGNTGVAADSKLCDSCDQPILYSGER